MQQLTEAFEAQNWYAVAAIVLGGLIWGMRKVTPAMWQKIPDGWRYVPPLVFSAGTGFITAYEAGKPLSAALMAGIAAVFYVGLPASGGAAWLKEHKLGTERRKRESMRP